MRDTRSRFVAFGVLPLLNALALFVHGIFLVTGTTGGPGAALIVTGLAMLCMLVALLHAGVRRARDLGWSGSTTFVVFGLSALLVVTVPLLVAWLAFAPGQGGAAQPVGWQRWAALALLLGMPWMLVLVARELG